MTLPYSRQSVGAEEAAAVAEAARAAWLTGGPTLARFECQLAERVGARHAVAVSSGTAALHVAYRAAGVDAGDTVLTSPLTFVATANAAVLSGALPRFADVDERGNLDPGEVARALAGGPRPRAVVPVHYAGHPAAVEAIAAAAAGAVVIEDACHALGAEYRAADGRWHRVGSCAHAALAVFSFHPVKAITTGEGGAVVTNDGLLAARCRRLRDHGLERTPRPRGDAADPWTGPWSYELDEVGCNYRLTDLQAALGLVQLGRLEGFIRRRRALAAAYARALVGLEAVRPVGPAPGTRSAFHLHPVRVPAPLRRAVFEAMRARGIGVQVHYVPVHLQPYYRRRLGTGPGALPAAERFAAEELSLPCFPDMEDGDVERVVGELVEALARASGGEIRGADRPG
jgi:UDP-4-amino-4,6-dideoxy-N-acetyl-beta-L-altrosamine transaminase